MQPGWQIQRARLGDAGIPGRTDFVDAVKQVVKANAAYVPPYGSGATLYVRPYMFGIAVRLSESSLQRSISSGYLLTPVWTIL